MFGKVVFAYAFLLLQHYGGGAMRGAEHKTRTKEILQIKVSGQG